MQQYKDLIDRIITKSQSQMDRTGVGTVYLFGEDIEFDLDIYFPIVALREIAYKQAFGELAGFIEGTTSKKRFTELGCTYWNTTGQDDNLGPIYGAQWRNWQSANGEYTDQLVTLINSLKNNPGSRRHILSTWNVGDMHKMALPPCHMTAQFNVDSTGFLDCVVYMRSVDVMLGLPYDIILYALLTKLLAKDCGYQAGKLKFFFGNTHIYKNHYMDAIKMLKLELAVSRPWLMLDRETTTLGFKPSNAEIVGYTPGPKMQLKLNL